MEVVAGGGDGQREILSRHLQLLKYKSGKGTELGLTRVGVQPETHHKGKEYERVEWGIKD